MKPIPQTMPFIKGKQRGDCFRACVASILELPINSVPHFVAIEKDWWGELQRWLAKWDLFALWIRLGDELALGYPAEETFVILNGDSPRGSGLKHSVVGRIKDGWTWEVTYDPHESGDGIIGLAESAVLFVPMHPERLVVGAIRSQSCCHP